MTTTFIMKRHHMRQRSMLMIFLMVAFVSVVFLHLSLSSSLHAETEKDAYWRIANTWVEEQHHSNSHTINGYFQELETKHRQTLPTASIEPIKLKLSDAVTYHIPTSREPDFALTALWEYPIDTRSIIEAQYERQERDAPLERTLSFFIGDGTTYEPLVFPFEVASLGIAKNKEKMPVLLNVFKMSYGSGTTGYVYSLTSDNTLQELLALNMWQDSTVQVIDFDHDGNAEIFHATLAYFPEELLTLVDSYKDGQNCRFYQAEIYQWIDDRATVGKINKFKRIGVKYYWGFPPFLDNDFSVKEGWDRCYALSKPWIIAENAKLPVQVQQYFAAIESWTQPPATSAVIAGSKLDLQDANTLGITKRETYERSYGKISTNIFHLAELTKIHVEQKSFVIALYKESHGICLFTLYLHDGIHFKKLEINTYNAGFQHKFQLIKLGETIPLLLNTSPLDIFSDAFFHIITNDHSLEKKLELNLFGGGFWFNDVDHDGDIEIILFNEQEAPAGIEKILEEHDLGAYVLFIPRITIYKWRNNGFVKLAVKYYEELPNDLLKEVRYTKNL